MCNKPYPPLRDHMTTEVALLRAIDAMNNHANLDLRDDEALEHLRRMLDQRGFEHHEPGCDRMTRAIDVWIYG